jgi:hypothetical protein
MRRYASGDNIPDVAIQPAASPISLNMLPAAGQPIRGANEFMQIAEALAPFNQGLVSFMKRSVDVDNERAAIAGQALDFQNVSVKSVAPEQRAAELNRQFRQVVSRSGVSDAANPYFEIAARQNLGRKLGFDYRAALYARKEQITDPDSPMPYAQASAEAAQEVLGDSLSGDFYGFAGFREIAQKTDEQMQLAFGEELVKRRESRGALLAKEAVTKAIINGDVEAADIAWGDYQTKVTDPNKVRANFIGTVKDLLGSAETVDDMNDRLDRLRALRYGNQMVDDNFDLMTEINQIEDTSRRSILAKMEHQSKLAGIALDNAKQDLFSSGFVTEAMGHIRNNGSEIAGGSLADWSNNYIDDLAKRRGWGQGVTDQLKSYAIEQTQLLAARTSAIGDIKSKEATRSLVQGIVDGSLKSEEDVLNAGAAFGVDAEDIAKSVQLLATRRGPVGSSIDSMTETLQQQNAGLLASHYNSNGAMPFGMDNRPTASAAIESNRHAMQITRMLLSRTSEFTSNQVKDQDGKFYSDYVKDSPQVAAAAVRRFMSDQNAVLVKEAMDSSDRAVAAGKVSMNGSWIKKENDPAASNWTPWRSMSDLVKRVSSGAQTMSEAAVPEEIRTVFGDRLEQLSEDYDVGYFSDGTVEQLRVAVAERLFSAMSLGPNGSVTTEDNDFMGGLWWFGGMMSTLVVDPLRGKPLGSAPWDAYDRWSTIKNVDQIREDYAAVMRLGGLTLDHVLHDKDQEGLPVFGLTLPKSREESIKAAFAVPLVQSLDELRDPGKVAAVAKKLGLTEVEVPQFVRAQQILHEARRIGKATFEGKAWILTTSQQKLQDAKSSYFQALERAKQKIGQ